MFTKKRIIVLYRDNMDWKLERKVVEEKFVTTNSRLKVKNNDLVIARFSALPFYTELENDINYLGAEMINNYEQHRYIADIGSWYYDLHEFTPTTWNQLHLIPDEGPFVLKGETNSKKFNWNTHMFAKNKKEAIKVHSRLTEDSLLQYQKIYIRKYIELEKICDGLQALPITREYRFFVYKNKILSGGFYWSSHTEELKEKGFNLSIEEVPKNFLHKIINKIQNTELCKPPAYYVIDVAKTTNGDWILIELNDGQMSGLSENDPEILYNNLKKELDTESSRTGCVVTDDN